MGALTCGPVTVDFDDRLLAHLQIVIIMKFRRNESFLLSWLDALATGDGRSSLWMAPSSPAYFKFAGSRLPTIDTDWVQRLATSAGSSSGLIVTDGVGKLARSTGRSRPL